jgi:hypothetical protein
VPALMVRGSAPEVLIALDSTKPTSVESLVRPLQFLGDRSTAVLAPGDVRDILPGTEWQLATLDDQPPESLAAVRAIIAAGHYMDIGGLAYRWARTLGARFNVVQHGLLTPHAPPLPQDAHLLAFSEADAGFWRSGRTDVTSETVGSQLLWTAQSQTVQEQPAPAVDPSDRPVFLGQLHGAELPRRDFARAAVGFCQATGALYRPHPSETDKLSRLQHALWERRGITIDRSGSPLATLAAPVASVFSTGVLEAAARGVPAWATHPDPPLWLQEFWERYRMSQWGQEPTPAPARPGIEPARGIALAVSRELGGTL